jgi:hypothetical protein
LQGLKDWEDKSAGAELFRGLLLEEQDKGVGGNVEVGGALGKWRDSVRDTSIDEDTAD